MKSLSIALVAALSILFFSNSATAQSYRTVSNNSYETADLAHVFSYELIKNMMKESGYTLASNDFFTISSGETKYKNRNLHSGVEYVIVVLPLEDGVNDLDLSICDINDNVIREDTDENSIAMIEYEPSRERTVRIKVKNYDSASSHYNYDCRLLIYYK